MMETDEWIEKAIRECIKGGVKKTETYININSKIVAEFIYTSLRDAAIDALVKEMKAR